MTEQSIAARLAELDKAATAGPWHRTVWVSGEVDAMATDHSTVLRAGQGRLTEQRSADVGLVVYLRNHVPEFLALIEAATEVMEGWADEAYGEMPELGRCRAALEALNRG